MSLPLIRICAIVAAALAMSIGCSRRDGDKRPEPARIARIGPPPHADKGETRGDESIAARTFPFADAPTTMTRRTREPPDGFVAFRWSTADEFEVRGYNIRRARSDQGPWSKANDSLIPARGGAGPNPYEFIDRELTPGMTYYYYIEEVTENGDERGFSQSMPMTVQQNND